MRCALGKHRTMPRGPFAGEFQPLAACKNLDYPPGNLRFLQFAIDENPLPTEPLDYAVYP